MCGLAGFILSSDTQWRSEFGPALQSMGDALKHRGPDGGGIWVDATNGIGLAHRRLAILDLAETGRQPMLSHDGRFAVAYNGEIYNFSSIKAELERCRGGIAWRGRSDTEILVEAFATWGIEPTLTRLNGMFAIAAWDRNSRKLFLARDRLGKKPLFYGYVRGRLVFASEVIALSKVAGWSFEPNHQAIAAYLRFGYVPGGTTAFEGIHKVPPGSILTVDANPASLQAPRINRYWTAASLLSRMRGAADAQMDPVDNVAIALEAAVKSRLVADVPLGAMLSGGIDSSLITALAQRHTGGSVRTFTLGWEGEKSSEIDAARAVSRHLGTLHTDLVVSPSDVISLVPAIAEVYDEPFSDVSAVPTYLVSRLAAQHIKVALAGDGADELFGGYSRYTQNDRLWKARRYPMAVSMARAGSAVSRRWFSKWVDSRWVGLATALAQPDVRAFYRSRVSHTHAPLDLIESAKEASSGFDNCMAAPGGISVIRRMMYMDMETYLPDDILVKVDRASMAHGLEVRSPFLDDSVVDLAWRLSDAEVADTRFTKELLRRVLYRFVPRELVDRPKTGFAFPLDAWLSGPLREWARSMTDDRAVQSTLRLRSSRIARIWSDFDSGQRRLGGVLWNIAMLSAWCSRFLRSAPRMDA